uniref:Putative secreted protein n=1 Tax=Panstrongylus lignarius TaxID=156445 RepID=A0A224Y1U5_9HEMI
MNELVYPFLIILLISQFFGKLPPDILSEMYVFVQSGNQTYCTEVFGLRPRQWFGKPTFRHITIGLSIVVSPLKQSTLRESVLFHFRGELPAEAY